MLALAAAGILFLIWVFAVAALFTDSISTSQKLLWFVALLLLAPVSIPVYFVVRHRRRTRGEVLDEA